MNPVIRLYEGLLNRAPDVDGLRYWADALRGGKSLDDVTNDFLNSPEGIANGFADLSNNDFVTKLYHSMGRDDAEIIADADGVAYWLNALNTETMSRAQVAQGFMESAENHAAIGGASATVLNGATSIDADGPVTLTGAQVTDDIVAKFHSSDDLTLSASGAQLLGLLPATAGRCGRGGDHRHKRYSRAIDGNRQRRHRPRHL